MTRVYLPVTLQALAGYVAAGSIPASSERYVAPDESEEAEYDALAAAAEDAAAALEGVGRRVVVVADVPDPDATFGLERVVAVHADTEDIDPTAGNLPELAWFATQEITELLA
jgi:hypothetical protein